MTSSFIILHHHESSLFAPNPATGPNMAVTSIIDEDLARSIAKEEQVIADEALARRLAENEAQPALLPRPSRAPTSAPLTSNNGVFQPSQTHMCMTPCIIGEGVCVEMMVDTGAQTSVISSGLAHQLGLDGRIDRSQRGTASGVGKAKIVGCIRSVGCELGNVEFLMDFIVLDTPDKILLLGLDLMRRYKCIVDLERDVLAFGGKGGVEVPLLPADEQNAAFRNDAGCLIS